MASYRPQPGALECARRRPEAPDRPRAAGYRSGMGQRPMDPDDASARVAVERFDGGLAWRRGDAVAREEPLEIRLGGASLAVVMRTPGHDEELALGFLVGERVVERADQVVSVRHCSVAERPEAEGNVIRALLAPGVRVDLEALRRNLFASSSCGLCGKATIENALATAPPLDDDQQFAADLFPGLPAQLARAQPGFSRTGGLHAAALFSADGALLVAREDVGRHNAVDKVCGWALRAGRVPLHGHGLLVSGRISYEVVQKALAARVPLVAAVSAPTSLAVELACAARMTLVAFLRGRAFNVYGERARITGGSGDGDGERPGGGRGRRADPARARA
jgi:FdhD protein